MNNKIILSIILVALVFISSCDKEKTNPVFENTKAPVLNTENDGASYILSDDIADSTFATIFWAKAEYNIATVVSYDIEVDLKANNFSNALSIGTTSDDSLQINVFKFNKMLIKKFGAEINQEVEVSLRIASYGGASEKTYSDAINMTITTYDPPWEPEEILVVAGSTTLGKIYQMLNADDEYEGKCEGYVWIPANNLEFLFSDPVEEFIFGDTDANGTLDRDGDNIIVAQEGHYKINVDTYGLTYTATAQSWGIIGSAVPPYDWSEDIDMTFDETTGLWTITQDLHAGQFKFRPNDSWNPLNYGDDGNDGIPDEYGANIDIGEGTYKITLDLNKYPYSYTVELQ